MNKDTHFKKNLQIRAAQLDRLNESSQRHQSVEKSLRLTSQQISAEKKAFWMEFRNKVSESEDKYRQVLVGVRRFCVCVSICLYVCIDVYAY